MVDPAHPRHHCRLGRETARQPPRRGLLPLALALLVLVGCQREQLASRAALRLGDGLPLPAGARFAVVDAAGLRISTLPPAIPEPERDTITAGLVAAATADGLVHDPEDPQLLALLYRELAAPRRGERHPVRVDWSHGARSGTYRYLLERRDYPDYRVGILVCDLIDAQSGSLLRQLIDPDYFLLRKLATKEGPSRTPIGYRFPLGVLAAPTASRYPAGDDEPAPLIIEGEALPHALPAASGPVPATAP